MNINAVSFRALILPYLVVPISVFFLLWDYFFNSGKITGYLPATPESLLPFAIFFGYPHIFASLIVLTTRDYFDRLQIPLTGCVFLALILAFLTPMVLGTKVLASIFFAATIYHVIAQQAGIVKIGLHADVIGMRLWSIWKWSCIAMGFLAVGVVYLDLPWSLLVAMAIPIVACGLVLLKFAKNTMASIYLFANICLLGAVGFAAILHSPFFIVLMPRVVHDINAFTIYAAHDVARSRLAKPGPLFLAKMPEGSYALFLTPFLGLILALPFSYFLAKPMVEIFAIAFAFLHYLVEHFVWRRESPLRQYLAVR